MNITVINGTEKHGVTYRLKELFLAEFKDKAKITEYYLPKDCPNFCNGCVTGRDSNPHRLTARLFGDFRLVLLGIPAYSFVVRNKNLSKIHCRQMHGSFD